MKDLAHDEPTDGATRHKHPEPGQLPIPGRKIPQAMRTEYHVPMRVLAAALLFALSLSAQEKKEETKKQPPPPPTNLKVLKVKTGPEVGQVMRTFTAGLGVQCAYCHVVGNFANDENPKKETARHMIRMTQEINAKFPDGKMHVSCYTCHRGEAEPKTAPEPKQ